MELLVAIPIAASIVWSINPPIIYKFARNAPPLIFTSVRAVFALIFVGTFLALNGINVRNVTPWIVLLVIASGVLGPGIGDAAYTRSIQLLGGSLAVVISYTYIFFAQLFSILMFNEKIRLVTAIGGVIAFTGIVVASLDNKLSAVNKRGLIYAFTASVCWGFATSLIKAVEEYFDVVSLAFWRLVSVALFTLMLSTLSREKAHFSRDFVVATALTGVLGWGIGMLLFVQAIYVLGVSVTVVATALTPVLSQLTSKLIAGEKASSRVLLGALLVATGIGIQILS